MIQENELPKVLIVSRAFRAGDAISILNFFEGWPQDNIYCISGCNSTFLKRFKSSYILGDKEQRYIRPLYLFLKIKPSEVCDCESAQFVDSGTPKWNALYDNVVKKLLMLFGIYNERIKINLSSDLISWIKKINPDIIYSSIGDIETGRLLLQIHNRFPDIKIVTHGFDDWITPSYDVMLRKRHIKKAEKVMRKVMDKAVLHLSTTDKMANEYHERYGFEFTTFSNPTELINSTANVSYDTDELHMTYIGKIGKHNALAITDMLKAITLYNKTTDKRVVLDIYTGTGKDELSTYGITTGEEFVIHKPIPNSEIPEVLAKSHALFLPISITKGAAEFAKYSMSTKMGEYMASHRPVLYYGPEDIAMTEFVLANNVAIAVTKRDTNKLVKAISRVLREDEELISMTTAAYEIANDKFNKKKVVADFQNLIKSI